MVRVLYVIGSLNVGGAERHLSQVVPRLLRNGVSPAIYTISARGHLASELEKAGVPVISPPFSVFFHSLPRLIGGPLLAISSAFRLFFLMRASRPDIVHFFLPQAYVFGALINLIAGRASSIMSRRSLNNYQNSWPVIARMEKFLHRYLDAALGNSQAVLEQLSSEGIELSRLGLIYNGLDLEVFAKASNKKSTRAGLGIADDALVLVKVANLISYKGHSDLLRALSMIKNQLPDNWCLICVGRDDGIGPKLRAEADELGIADNILWLGQRYDTADLYTASDIGLLVSHEEGFSNSILEGMAAAVPMIVSDVGGNAEAVAYGKCGVVVPVKDSSSLAREILSLSGDECFRREIGRAGQIRVREFFNIDRCVREYCCLYRSIASGKKENVQHAIEVAGLESVPDKWNTF